MRVLPVECEPALDPSQRLLRLAARDQHSGEGMAVLRGEPGLIGEGDVGREVFLRKVDRAQQLAPMPAKILGFVCPAGFTRRRLGRGMQPRSALWICLSNAASPALSNALAASFSIW